jgi:hypothetical protein
MPKRLNDAARACGLPAAARAAVDAVPLWAARRAVDPPRPRLWSRSHALVDPVRSGGPALCRAPPPEPPALGLRAAGAARPASNRARRSRSPS